MDVSILKENSAEFKNVVEIQNVGNALTEGQDLELLQHAFDNYYKQLNQYPIKVTTLSSYYEMVLMVLVQCDLNHKYIQLIQQLSSQDQAYLKDLIENLFKKLSTPQDSQDNELTSQLKQEISRLHYEIEELKRNGPASTKSLHNDLVLAEEKINEMDVMIQKQSSIITDLTGKLKHQSNLSQVNQTLKQEIEELKHKLIKLKKMEQSNGLLLKKVDTLHDLEAHTKHLEQVNQELMNQLKGEPQHLKMESTIQKENKQLQMHQIQLQEELSATLDRLAFTEQEKMAQIDYIRQLEERCEKIDKMPSDSTHTSPEMLRQVDPNFNGADISKSDLDRLIAERNEIEQQLVFLQSQNSTKTNENVSAFDMKLKEYMQQIHLLKQENSSISLQNDKLNAMKYDLQDRLDKNEIYYKERLIFIHIGLKNLKKIKNCIWTLFSL